MQPTDQLKAYLAAKQGSAVQISEFRQLSGGACQDNYLLRMQSELGSEELVLRTDKGGARP